MDKTNYLLEVNRTNIAELQVVESKAELPSVENAVLLKVDRFAITANNVTYGITGDMLGYWQFFPTEKPWGRLPVMGFAEVVASNHADIEVGERVWGFFPMGNYLAIEAGQVSRAGFSDISKHRQPLAAIYSRFERVANNPLYQQSTEDYQMLFKGLYTTAWLIEDFFADQGYCNAEQYLVTSASSKTSIAMAYAAKQAGNLTCVGLTSSSRVDYVKSLGLYQQVLSYDDIEQLNADIASILVDMSGADKVVRQVHHHFAESLKYSCKVGATHIGDLLQDAELAGPTPEMFFAPSQFAKRAKEIGGDKITLTIADSLNAFIEYSKPLISINEIDGLDNAKNAYLSVLSGKANANEGIIVQLTDK